MTIQHNPNNLMTQYLGPLVPLNDKSDRKLEKFSSQLSPSYVPDLLLNHSPVLITWNGVNYWVPYTWVQTDGIMLRPMVTLDLLQALSDDIMNQFVSRIASFWRQLLLVYRTGLQFLFCDRADLQVGVPGGTITPDSVKNAYECAHTATLPALRVQSVSPSHAIAFGHLSTFHYLDNSTTWLPTEVNQVDSALDRYARSGYIPLRQAATQILNRVSSGSMTPKMGLMWFLSYARAHLLVMLTEFSAADEQKKNVIVNYYGCVVDQYSALINEQDFIQRLSVCHLPEEDLYLFVQKGMHDLFISEMAPKRPWIDPVLLNKLKYHSYCEIHSRLLTIKEWKPTNETKKGKVPTAIDKHVNQAYMNNFVNVSTLDYAASISLFELDHDVSHLQVDQIPPRLAQVHHYVIASLIDVKKPRSIGSILFKVLVNLPRHLQNLKDQGLIT